MLIQTIFSDKLRELYENERRQRETAEKKLEQSAKSSREST